METVIDVEEKGFGKDELEDISRCLKTLYSVIAGTMPLDRNFGINTNEIMGYPTEVAKNKLSVEIIQKTSKIEYDVAEDGQLKPHIYLKKGNSA